ncbi:Zinc finger, PHD-type [Gossypium australe]|uniref:Zinc finger, PHD-type n=1 Tax=Gossypium australe TaxID=47621 RepID=A0A5B6VU79_9ROSI|nr:Zinc finger, PHD-type [Gossypium australe]
MCSFSLDFDCAKLSPSLKLDCHHHLLTFFKYFNKKGEEGQDSYCKACGKHCGGASVYRCVKCHFSLHLKCVIPSLAIHKYHKYPLTMMELIKEDDSEKYYCDVCENERNPKDPVYYCQSCTFIAHIQYVLDQDKVASGKVPSSSPPPMENKALFVEQNEGSNAIRTLSLFRPIIHPHQLYEVTEELKGQIYCSGCRLVLNGSSYFCKTCPDFYLHEKCAKLSYEIQHPFHSSHPLNLYTSWVSNFITCEVCRDICDGFIYFCEQCDFKLDMKCVTLKTHKIGVLEEKITGRVTELHHFTHPHKLVIANCNDPKHKRKCNICRLQILSPAYRCPERFCGYKLHESCLRLPQKIRVPFHPNHMLVSRLLPTAQRCYACTLELRSGEFVYSCEICDFNLHVICANSLRRPLKCKFHPNDLYYFGRNHISTFDLIWGKIFNCEVCDGSCRREPFYRCLKCGIIFHLKYAGIPYTVKFKYHIHPLLLKDSFIKDECGKYYCDFCEEERNPNDDIYYCEECNDQTITHIECVLVKVS